MQSVRNRPIQAGRPAWVSAADWLLIQERAREIAEERKAAQHAKMQRFVIPLADAEDLDYAWAQDNQDFVPGHSPSLGGPSRSRTTETVPREDREKMDREADCSNCGHVFRTYALTPNCSRCNSKAVKLGAWERRLVRGQRPATCRKCAYEWMTSSLSRPTCSHCHSKAVHLGPMVDES